MVGTIKTFISYSSQDGSYLRQLFESLETIGANPYVAEWWLETGQPLADKIMRHLGESTCLVVLLSDEANKSAWVHEEIGYAVAKEKPVIPVIEKSVNIRGFLEGREYIAYEKNNFDNTIYKTILSVRNAVYRPPILSFMRPWRALDTLKFTCKACDTSFTTQLPSQEEINKAIEQSKVFKVTCPSCSHENKANPKTFKIIE